jgi:hypothetical protein
LLVSHSKIAVGLPYGRTTLQMCYKLNSSK